MVSGSKAKVLQDLEKLRTGRDLLIGRETEPDASSYFPFFFNRDSATVNLNGMYRAASAFLIGGGPSFARVPKAPLRRVWCMTLNNAHASFRGQASCVVDEPSRFSLSMWLDPNVQKFVPAAYFESSLWDNRSLRVGRREEQQWQRSSVRVSECPNVVGYRRNEKFNAARWLTEDTINWGDHESFGGGRSVLLAALRILYILGFRSVFLLGVDFSMAASDVYHFSEERKPNSVRGNHVTYEKLEARFVALKPYFAAAGFSVWNCNKSSNLKAFDYIPFTKAIARATGTLGDYEVERTLGMYRTPGEKERMAPLVKI